MIPPSGRQVELRFENQRAVVTEVGGGLRRYDLDTWAVVDGYHRDAICDGGRGQLLLPWPNRIGDGGYRFDGADHQLPLDEPDRFNAIHGLVRWAAWSITQLSDSSARATHCLHPRPGYPFHLELLVDYQLSNDGLAMTVNATNVGDDRAPFGAGWHPYVTVETPQVDAATLEIPAERRIPTDERGLPCSDAMSVDGTEFDFRRPRPIGASVLDTCYTGLQRDGNGVMRARLSDAEGARTVEVWGDTAINYIMAFTGDTLAADRRRRGLALEPMTCPPDAFRSGIDLVVLDPGETCTARLGIRPSLTL